MKRPRLVIPVALLGGMLMMSGCHGTQLGSPTEHVIVVDDSGFVDATRSNPRVVSPGDQVVYQFSFPAEYIGICVKGVISPIATRIVPDTVGGAISIGVPMDASRVAPPNLSWKHVRIKSPDHDGLSCDGIFGLPSGDEGGARVGP